MRRLPLVLLALPLFTAGCADDFCGDDLAPLLEVGDGTHGFLSIDDGAVLQVERGSQGGQHIWAGLVASGLHPGSEDISEGLRNDDLPWIRFELESVEGVHSNENLQRRPLDRYDDGSFGLETRQVPFRHWPVLPDDWAEQDIGDREAFMESLDFVLRATVEDACDDTVTDEVTVRLAFPPREETG